MTRDPSAATRLHMLEGTYNLRDTGGYDAAGGGTRWGKLFRSDALHALTDGSRAQINTLGISYVADLRDHSELLSAPSQLDGLGITVLHLPIYSQAPSFTGLGEITLPGLYRLMIAEYGENLARAVTFIARSGSDPVLVHCTAGKDRTGLVIALALLAVGVGKDDVIADYAATEENLAGEWAEMMLAHIADGGLVATPAIEYIVSASPPGLIAEIIDQIESDYGSAAGYLLAHGFQRPDLDLLRESLVETTPVLSPESEKSAT
ncbi:MAG: protein tyrosine phosphatase [Glaciihabitans sp.]|nr:protein tyrosine phosphatase [Glaciihabitans sp.]